MKILKWAFVVWSVFITVVVLLSVGSNSKDQTGTLLFCAYNRVFIEFNENGKRWGTMLLDFQGIPVPCVENIEEEKTSPRGIIL